MNGLGANVLTERLELGTKFLSVTNQYTSKGNVREPIDASMITCRRTNQTTSTGGQRRKKNFKDDVIIVYEQTNTDTHRQTDRHRHYTAKISAVAKDAASG